MPASNVRLQERALRQVLKKATPVTVNFTYPSARGKIEQEVRIIPEFDAKGVSSILMIAQDITDRKRIQELAEKSERDIRKLTANLITAQEHERRRRAAYPLRAATPHGQGCIPTPAGDVLLGLGRASAARPCAAHRGLRGSDQRPQPAEGLRSARGLSCAAPERPAAPSEGLAPFERMRPLGRSGSATAIGTRLVRCPCRRRVLVRIVD